VYLDNSCLYQNVLYSSLLECLNATSDIVMSNHDFYEHEGGGANLLGTSRQVAYLLLCFFV
jgi:hypothetical protein